MELIYANKKANSNTFYFEDLANSRPKKAFGM